MPPPGGCRINPCRPESNSCFSTACLCGDPRLVQSAVSWPAVAGVGKDSTAAWVVGAPLNRICRNLCAYAIELCPQWWAATPAEPNAPGAASCFVRRGTARLTLDGDAHVCGGVPNAYIPPATRRGRCGTPAIRPCGPIGCGKRLSLPKGYDATNAFVPIDRMSRLLPDWPRYRWGWATQRFADPGDLRHDMHVNIVPPAGRRKFRFAEPMFELEHRALCHSRHGGLFAEPRVVPVEAANFMWLRRFFVRRPVSRRLRWSRSSLSACI